MGKEWVGFFFFFSVAICDLRSYKKKKNNTLGKARFRTEKDVFCATGSGGEEFAAKGCCGG